MKKIFCLIVLIFVLLSAVQVQASYESWKRGVPELVEKVENEYGDRLELAALEHDGVEKEDLWAKVVVESNGDVNAVSETAVKGLTMITFDVINLIEEETGIIIDRLHPFEAMWGAGWYLHYLMTKYNFTLEEAHGAYFYGPTGLKDQLKENNISDLYHVKKINFVKAFIADNY